MSRSNPQVKNPATRFFQWSGGAENVGTKDKPEWEGGTVSYWDKEAQESVEVPLPLTFLVLDELHTITGFNDAQHSGYWSNEVRDLASGELIVRTKQGIQARGTYAKIKAEALNGLKYAKSMYIAYYNDEKELVIGHMKLSGAALTAWIEFNKSVDVYKAAVALTGADGPKTKGKTKYFVPVFDSMKVSAAAAQQADELDKQLQAYLGTYLARKPDTEDAGYATSAEELDDKKDDVEIEEIDEPVTLGDGTPVADNEAAEPSEPQEPAPKPSKGDESINLHDVEF